MSQGVGVKDVLNVSNVYAVKGSPVYEYVVDWALALTRIVANKMRMTALGNKEAATFRRARGIRPVPHSGKAIVFTVLGKFRSCLKWRPRVATARDGMSLSPCRGTDGRLSMTILQKAVNCRQHTHRGAYDLVIPPNATW